MPSNTEKNVIGITKITLIDTPWSIIAYLEEHGFGGLSTLESC